MTNFPRGNGLSQLLAATKQANCWQFRQLTRENSQTSIQCVPAEPHRTTLEDERKNSATDYRLHFRDNCFCFFCCCLRQRLPSNMEPLVQSLGWQWAIHGPHSRRWKPDFFPGRVFTCLAFRDARWTRPAQWVQVLSHDCVVWQSITFLLKVPGTLRVN